MSRDPYGLVSSQTDSNVCAACLEQLSAASLMPLLQLVQQSSHADAVLLLLYSEEQPEQASWHCSVGLDDDETLALGWFSTLHSDDQRLPRGEDYLWLEPIINSPKPAALLSQRPDLRFFRAISLYSRRERRVAQVVLLAQQQRLALPSNQANMLLQVLLRQLELHCYNLLLQEQRQHYQQLFDNSPDILYAIDRQGRLQMLNARLNELLGLAPGEALGNSYKNILHPESYEDTHVLVRHKQGQPGLSYETHMEAADGSLHYFEVTIVPRWQGKHVVGAFGFARDVSEVRRAQAHAQNRDIYLRSVLDSMTDGFAALDREFRFRYLNPRAEEIIGKPLKQVSGQVIWEAFPTAEPSPLYQAYRRVMQGGNPESFESYSSLLQRWFEVHIYANPEGISVYFRDISQRKAAMVEHEQQHAMMTRILESISEAYMLLDQHWRVQYVNPHGMTLTDVAPEAIIGKSITEIWTSWYSEAVQQAFQRATQDNVATQVRSYSSHNARWLELRIYPIEQGLAVYINDVTERQRTQAALERSEARYRSVLATIKDVIFQSNQDNRWTFLNPAWQEFSGYSVEESLGNSLLSYVHSYDNESIRHAFARLFDFQTDYLRHELRFITREGALRWGEIDVRLVDNSISDASIDSLVHSLAYSLADNTDTLPGAVAQQSPSRYTIGRLSDITERRTMESALRRAHERLSQQVKVLKQTKVRLEQANQQLDHEANHDALTQLYNRLYFLRQLEQALQQQQHNNPDESFAVFFLDFNRFKIINDTLGHSIGDLLLQGISQRLRHCVRPQDIVARLGGDEFTVLANINQAEQSQQALHMAERMVQAFRSPFQLDGHEVKTSASVGIVLYNEQYRDSETLLRDADIAMYYAKHLSRRSGGGQYQLFSEEIGQPATRRLQLEQQLRYALEQQRMQVYYQPILQLSDQSLIGFEALLRWQHPEYGAITPQEFIPLAEDSGDILSFDYWVISQACAQIQGWQSVFAQNPPLALNINLSENHFANANNAVALERHLASVPERPGNLSFEIVEALFAQPSEALWEALQRLREQNVSFYIENFGSSYVSLHYLHHLNVSALKINIASLDELSPQSHGRRFVEAIITMAHSLNIRVLAKGVETPAQLQVLRDLQCDYVQGYLFSHALDAIAMEKWLEQHRNSDNIIIPTP